MSSVQPERAYVGLGANLGHPEQTIMQAVQALRANPRLTVVACSSLWSSAPQDAPGPEFFNAVIAVQTDLSARQLLDQLQDLERQFGRERPFPNAPRSLDLDLLMFGNQVLNEPDLTLPHPRMHMRAFVLEPLAEINPRLHIPLRGPIAQWRQQARGQVLHRLKSL